MPTKMSTSGSSAGQLFLVALRQAAGDDQELAAGVVLAVRQVQDGVDALLLRFLDEGAGVDDDDIRLPLVGRYPYPSLER